MGLMDADPILLSVLLEERPVQANHNNAGAASHEGLRDFEAGSKRGSSPISSKTAPPGTRSPVLSRGARCESGRAAVLQALDSLAFPESKRANVRTSDSPPALGLCLGMTSQYFRGPILSRASRERPVLSKLLCAFAHKELPGFTFTSIQVNKDYAAAMHVDKNNDGTSYIIGLGPYTGGRLWIDDGSFTGRSIDLRGQWFCFDGNMPHCVLPFRGHRYTLVYFNRKNSHDVLVNPRYLSLASQLRALGFPLPVEPAALLTYQSARERLAVGALKFARFQRRSKAFRFVLCMPPTRKDASDDGGLEVESLSSIPASVPLSVHVEVAPGTTMAFLMEQVASRFGLKRVRLSLGSLELLPSDTPQSLGLKRRRSDAGDGYWDMSLSVICAEPTLPLRKKRSVGH